MTEAAVGRLHGGPAEVGEVGEVAAVAIAQPATMIRPLAPATLTDMLDGGYRLLHRRPGIVLGLSALFIVPSAILAGLSSIGSPSPFATIFTPGSFTGSSTDFPLAALLLTMVALAVRSLGIMYLGVALTTFVVAERNGQPIGTAEAARLALRRSGAVLGSWPLLALASVAAYTFCFLPLAVWLTFTAVVAPVIAAEGAGPIAAIGRSFSLVGRRFWMALGVVLLSSLVAQVLAWILTIVPTALAQGLPWGAQWAVAALVNALAAMLTTGPLVLTSVLLYLDLRVRTEGLDLRQRATVAFARAG